jgi:eukaryotic-like serine/threonine-protein kinase
VEIERADGTDGCARRRIGVRLAGKWSIVRLLGIGGMAAVYEAHHATGRRVAVKMMHAHLKENRRLHKRFVREAYVANSLAHPAVVPVYDVDVHDDGTPYLIMDLLIGENLERFRKKQGGRLPPEQVTAVAEVVLEVLVEAHSKGIVHRDLKPANLFITKQGELKIFDFGIAKCAQFSPLFTASTRYGSLLGTPAFMSPEQARGRWEAVDHQSDLWSLGATLFTLLTGRVVHNAACLNEQWALAMGAPAIKVRDLDPELPERLVTAVDGALCFAKSERWPSAAAMFHALTGREAPARSSAEVHHVENGDHLATLSRAVSLEGTRSRPGRPSMRPRILGLTASAVGVVALGTASQWNPSWRVPLAVTTPELPLHSQRSEASGAEGALAKHMASPEPAQQRKTRGTVVAQDPSCGCLVQSGDAPQAADLAVEHAEKRTARLRAPTRTTMQLEKGLLHKAARREEPSLGNEVEFGSLLDVWE